jgi:hypothetical protein
MKMAFLNVELTIVRLNALQMVLPAQVLAIDITHVGDEKSIFVASLARVVVDVLHPLLQGTSDHLLGDIVSLVLKAVVQDLR